MPSQAGPLPQSIAFPIEDVSIDEIFDGNRLREIEPAWAEAMAAAMEQGARLPPVVLRRPDPREGITQLYALVSGGHRLVAHRFIGRVSIRAEISTYDALQARLAEIEENLIRHELTPLDRAVFLAEHKRVYEELYPDTQHGAAPKSRKKREELKSQGLRFNSVRFTKAAAERCNLSERTVQAALTLVSALSPEAIQILRGTEWARNASELQRLSAEPADRQVRLARLHSRGEGATVAKARLAAGDAPTGEGDPQEELFRRIVSNWQRLDAKGRKRFLEHAGLVAREQTPRERMTVVNGVAHDPRQVDLEEAIAPSRKGAA